MNLHYPDPLQCSSSSCSRRKPLWICGTNFYRPDAFLSPINSIKALKEIQKHWLQPEKNHWLPWSPFKKAIKWMEWTSFLDPPLQLWGQGIALVSQPSHASTLTHTHTHRDTRTRTHTTILWPSCIPSRTTQVSRHQKCKTNLDLLQQESVSGSGISWAICKSAPWPRHITMPASHHSVFYRLDALHATPPTASKHWRPAPFFFWYSAV